MVGKESTVYSKYSISSFSFFFFFLGIASNGFVNVLSNNGVLFPFVARKKTKESKA